MPELGPPPTPTEVERNQYTKEEDAEDAFRVINAAITGISDLLDALEREYYQLVDREEANTATRLFKKLVALLSECEHGCEDLAQELIDASAVDLAEDKKFEIIPRISSSHREYLARCAHILVLERIKEQLADLQDGAFALGIGDRSDRYQQSACDNIEAVYGCIHNTEIAIESITCRLALIAARS